MASSKNKNTPAVDAAAGTGTANAAESVAPKPKSNRGGRPAGPVFAWDGERDQLLALTLLQNPGVLTPQQLVGHLAQHPAYAADASLLTAEKIRQRVAKLSARAEKMGYGRLQLRRTGGGGYDPTDTLASVFKSLGVAPQPQPQQASTTGHVHEVQVPATAAAPEIQYVQPTSTGGSGGGGLIPIAGASGLIPTPGQ